MKTTKKLFAVLFAILIMVSLSVQAFAAGEETWYGPQVQERTMTIRNNNTTPIKTMGVSGKLHISASVSGRPDLEPAGCPKVKLYVEIRDVSTGAVLDYDEVREDAFMPSVNLEADVYAGQRIQIFFDVSSVSYNPNGNYRYADVTYSHEIY